MHLAQVNPVEAKQLTNIRAAGSDEKIFLAPPRQFSLEEVCLYADCHTKSAFMRVLNQLLVYQHAVISHQNVLFSFDFSILVYCSHARCLTFFSLTDDPLHDA